MSEAETSSPEDASPPTPPREAAAAPPRPSPPAPRELPEVEAIGRWAQGEELPSLAALFQMPTGAPLPLVKFDALGMQIKKEELLPQHWQVIADHSTPDASLFDGLGETARLRIAYGDSEVASRRLENLKLAWSELAGRQPSLWTVSDLFVAMRRLLDRKADFDVHALLCAARDVWRGMTLPHGREQLEILWACLAFIRTKTKK